MEGCVVTTSESVLFEMVGDAGRGEFKEVAKLVKQEKGATAEAVGALCGGLYGGGDGGDAVESEDREGRGSRL